jgi:two-component sensor histidine kinase
LGDYLTSKTEAFSVTSPTLAVPGAAFQQPADCPRGQCSAIADGQKEIEHLTLAKAELRGVLAREHRLLKQTEELVEKQNLLSREANHRLLNSLQMVSSLLFMQGRQASDTAIIEQLNVAARRVATIGNVHRRLHAMDQADTIELKPYLSALCEDLTGLLPGKEPERALILEGIDIKVPAAIGVPLGLIVSEMITNAAKYAKGKITVSLRKHPLKGYALSVSDDGPGLPVGFDPKESKGLGMSIISSLVNEIGGELLLVGNAGRGTVLHGSLLLIEKWSNLGLGAPCAGPQFSGRGEAYTRLLERHGYRGRRN